jgi:hypothetical protein
MNDMIPNYILIYDEEFDAISSLEILAANLCKVIDSPHHWKWVFISLHNALQGFMVLSLQGTNSLNVLTPKSAREWLEGYESGRPLKNPTKLDYFLELYGKIKSDAMIIWSNSKPFVPNSTQDRSVRRINDFRNVLIHYIPASSAFNMKTRTQDLLDVIPIIESLAFESNNVFNYDEGKSERVRKLCISIRKQASEVYESYCA